MTTNEFKAQVQSDVDKLIRQGEIDAAHEAGNDCEQESCQECCPHDERDHGICYDCGHEEDPGIAIDRATDYFEDR